MANGGWWDAVPRPGGLWTVTTLPSHTLKTVPPIPDGAAIVVLSSKPVTVETMRLITHDPFVEE